MPLRLVILDGPRAGEGIPLEPGRHVLGRSPNLAAIAIEDPMISRRHLELVIEGEACRVRDLGAANGTVLRGRLVPPTEVPLEPGEELLLGGRVRVRLVHEGDTRRVTNVLDQAHRCAECGREISLATFADGEVFENAGVFICPACVARVRQEARQVVAGYEILERIGEGGMGSVYKARQLSIGRLVALKTIRHDLAREEKAVRRFLREAQLAARLTHPNIVMLYDTGEAQGTYYIAMEYVEGQTLRKLADDGHPLAARRVLELGRQLASALAHAGSLGIVHRDVKPDNVLVTADDQAKLMDFGLVKAVETSGLSRLTTSGAMMGTLHYMPPEQLSDAANADHRADVYALGATLFHALTGQVPFRRKGRVAIMRAIAVDPPESLRESRPDLPREVEDLVHRAMAKQPEDRWQDAREMAAALAAALDRMP